MSKLIITDGSKYLRCGDTMVVGVDWVLNNDITKTICGVQLDSIYVYEPIPFDVFMYCLSRVRCPNKIVESRGDRRGAFANLDGLWIGNEKVYNSGDRFDSSCVEGKWYSYWERDEVGQSCNPRIKVRSSDE